MSSGSEPAIIEVDGLTMAFGDFVLQRDIDFEVRRGEIFFIIGDSGSGKSTLLRHMLGLIRPAAGEIRVGGTPVDPDDDAMMQHYLRRIGVLYQAGALFSSMSLSENVELVLQQQTALSGRERRDVAEFKLALVGLAGFEGYMPSEISGGMRKRAGLARAIAMDPELLFLDEPSAGLDPLSARRLDELVLQLRDTLGVTVVIVSHELASIFAIGTDCIFLDSESRHPIGRGAPRDLRDRSESEKVRRFLAWNSDAPPAATAGARQGG